MLLLLAACAELPPPTLTVSDEVGTVVRAAWSTGVAGRTRVVVDEGGEPWLATEWQEPALLHEATLLGLHTGGAYTARVEAESGGSSEPAAFTTGELPPAVPAPTLSGEPGFDGWLLTTLVTGTDTGPLLLDAQGRVVWWHLSDSGGRATRARLRADGAGAWFGYAESESRDVGGLRAVDWVGAELAAIEAPAFSHDFVQRRDGSLAWIEFDRRTLDSGGPVWGNRIREGGPDAAEVVWSTFDTWDPAVDGTVQPEGYWTGVNALDLDEDAGRYAAGCRGLGALVEIERATGQVLRQIGGPRSDYTLAKGATLENQHQFELLDGGVLVHDNRTEAEGSRVVQLALDDDAATATATWTWQHDPPLYVYALGDVDRLDDGGTLVTWTTAGTIDDVGPDGALRASYTLPLGAIYGFLERLERLPGMQPP